MDYSGENDDIYTNNKLNPLILTPGQSVNLNMYLEVVSFEVINFISVYVFCIIKLTVVNTVKT